METENTGGYQRGGGLREKKMGGVNCMEKDGK